MVVQLLPDQTLLFFRNRNQCLLQTVALKPAPQIICDGINESLLFQYQEWLVFRIEHAQLAAGLAVDTDLRLQLVCKALIIIPGGESPAIEFDHGSSNLRELHCGYQMLKNLLADIICR